jgi:hypothetical protein
VVREVSVVISSVGCEDQPYSWVRREGREETRKKERSTS